MRLNNVSCNRDNNRTRTRFGDFENECILLNFHHQHPLTLTTTKNQMPKSTSLISKLPNEIVSIVVGILIDDIEQEVLETIDDSNEPLSWWRSLMNLDKASPELRHIIHLALDNASKKADEEHSALISSGSPTTSRIVCRFADHLHYLSSLVRRRGVNELIQERHNLLRSSSSGNT